MNMRWESLIFLLVEFGDNAVEFFEIKTFVVGGLVVDVGGVKHFQDVLVVNYVTRESGKLLQLVVVDVVIAVFVEMGENSSNALLGLHVSDSW